MAEKFSKGAKKLREKVCEDSGKCFIVGGEEKKRQYYKGEHSLRQRMSDDGVTPEKIVDLNSLFSKLAAKKIG